MLPRATRAVRHRGGAVDEFVWLDAVIMHRCEHFAHLIRRSCAGPPAQRRQGRRVRVRVRAVALSPTRMHGHNQRVGGLRLPCLVARGKSAVVASNRRGQPALRHLLEQLQ